MTHEVSTRPMRLLKAFGGAGALVVAAIVGGTLISSVLAAPATTGTDSTTLADDADGRRLLPGLPGRARQRAGHLDRRAHRRRASSSRHDHRRRGDRRRPDRCAGDRAQGAHRGQCRRRLRAPRWAPCTSAAAVDPADPGRLPLGDLLGVAADTLGVEQSDLVDRLRAGETLADIATAEGVDIATVTGAVTDALDAALADAVAAGDLTQARADEIAAHVAQELADGSWPDHPGRGHRLAWARRHARRGGQPRGLIPPIPRASRRPSPRGRPSRRPRRRRGTAGCPSERTGSECRKPLDGAALPCIVAPCGDRWGNMGTSGEP